MTQPNALFLADILEDGGKPADIAEQAAAELRRLYLVEQALDRCRVVCDATSEGWRADAERWRAQRDALLEALKSMLHMVERHAPVGLAPTQDSPVAKARAAIKAAEENT